MPESATQIAKIDEPLGAGSAEPVESAAPAIERKRGLLRALSHRNFRLFMIGQGVSLIGTWIQNIALVWLVVQMTDSSAAWSGRINFAGQIPALLFAPFAGLLVDHVNRYRLLGIVQTVMMVQAFLLAGLVLSGHAELWHLLALNFILGVANVVDIPTRQAIMPEMLADREDLSNAIALNSTIFNLARLMGPALGGFVFACTGAGICFLLNAFSFVAVLTALAFMQVPPLVRRVRAPAIVDGLREGFNAAFSFKPIRVMMILTSVLSVASSAYMTLLPVYAKLTLGGDATTFGMLQAASGFGALLGAATLVARKSVVGLGWWILVLPAAFGLEMVLFSFVNTLPLACLLLCVNGYVLMMQLGATNIVLQTILPDDQRGRVMSYYMMAFLGVAPLGSLLGGDLAERIGRENVLRIGGGLCIVATLVFLPQATQLRNLVRPIYARLRILPESVPNAES
jgi:MFS family permease